MSGARLFKVDAFIRYHTVCVCGVDRSTPGGAALTWSLLVYVIFLLMHCNIYKNNTGKFQALGLSCAMYVYVICLPEVGLYERRDHT